MDSPQAERLQHGFGGGGGSYRLTMSQGMMQSAEHRDTVQVTCRIAAIIFKNAFNCSVLFVALTHPDRCRTSNYN